MEARLKDEKDPTILWKSQKEKNYRQREKQQMQKPVSGHDVCVFADGQACVAGRRVWGRAMASTEVEKERIRVLFGVPWEAELINTFCPFPFNHHHVSLG